MHGPQTATPEQMHAGPGASARGSRSFRILLGVLLVVAGGFVVSLFASSPARASQQIKWYMECWNPHTDTLGICGAGSPDVLQGVDLTLNASLSSCDSWACVGGETGYSNSGVVFRFSKEGNGVVNYTSPVKSWGSWGGVGFPTSATASWTIPGGYATAGARRPAVQVCRPDLSQCTGWDKWDVAGIEYDLDVGTNTPPSATMQWWSPCKFILTCVAGSPDGVPGPYTLTADFSDSDNYAGSRIVSVQWDFGDGSPIQTDTWGPANQASGTRTVVHNYTVGVYRPAVRFCDNGGCGGWDKKDILGIETDLDVVDDPPSVTMEWWSPCYKTLGLCSGGSPDGRSNQNFTLNATGSDDIGVTAYEWDFDGNGTVDQTTGGGNNGTVTHNYNTIGSWQPQVRAVDGSGQRSGWDKKDIALVPVDLDTDGPSASVNMPNPCWGIYPACVHGSPDATTADVVQMSADYSDAFGVAVDHVDWDFDGNGSVDASSPASGTSGTASTTHQYGSAGAYTIKARAVGVDGAAGNWNNWKILGIGADYDVTAAQVRAQMGCPSPHTTTLGIDCAGAPDVRQGSPVTLNAGIDVCAALCVGNYFTPTNIGSYDIEWRLGDGSPSMIDHIGGGANRTHAVPAGYANKGAYRPEVRLCDVAATSTNCTNWDRYDFGLVEYDYDVGGPEVSVNMPNPCFGIYPACVAGAPDATTADVVQMSADYTDPFGVSVDNVEWDFDGNGSVDATSSASGTSGTSSTTHQYNAGGAYTIKARAVGSDGVVGDWNNWKILGISTDYDVSAAGVRARMDCPSPHTTTLGIDCAGSPDVRVGAPVTLGATLDSCAVLCVGNYFTPTNVNSYDIEWRLGDGSPSMIDHIGGVSNRTHSVPGGYVTAGAYRPEVRLCDDAAASINCSNWDRYDFGLVEYDYDVGGPEVSVNMPNPCFGIYPACIGGSPDATTADVVAMSADYNDPFSPAVAVDHVEWDFGDGSPAVTSTASGTSGTVTTTHQYGAAGAYTIKARAVGVDGAVGLWNDWKILGISTAYDVSAAKVRAQMGCPTPHKTTLGIDCAGAPDVRVGAPVTLNAGIDTCGLGILCIGNYFTPTDVGSYDIEWRLGDGSPSMIDHIGGGANRTHSVPGGYAVAGAYRPEVRLCDDATLSLNCTNWDAYDFGLVEYDYDVDGPSATVDNPEPCFGIYPACIHGSPDASTADVVTMHMSYDDSFGVAVDHVEWDFDGNGTVDDTTSVSGTSGSATTTHQYLAAGAYTIKARAVGVDGAIGLWDEWSILGLHADYDVNGVQFRAQMGCWDPHDATVFICGAGSKDVRKDNPVTFSADIDSCSLGLLCIGNYFTPTDQNHYDIEWRLNGPGPVTSAIDHIGGATSPRTHQFPGGYSATGAYRPEVRLCDDAATSTNCSNWDKYDVALVEYDLDVWTPCTGDADHDGVPCYFDPDGDTQTYNHQLNYVRQAASPALPAVILTNSQPDMALIAPLNVKRTNFFGNWIYAGPMNFLQADVINPNGTYLNLKWAHVGLWATPGIGSSPHTAYLKGVSFCLGKKTGALFGYAFGFCTYEASLDHNTQPLAISDSVLFASYIPGYGATDYEGWTLPAISPRIEVDVTP